jgi:hypothetical protein
MTSSDVMATIELHDKFSFLVSCSVEDNEALVNPLKSDEVISEMDESGPLDIPPSLSKIRSASSLSQLKSGTTKYRFSHTMISK